jgi:biopolymer transport protein ExbB/TolQ
MKQWLKRAREWATVSAKAAAAATTDEFSGGGTAVNIGVAAMLGFAATVVFYLLLHVPGVAGSYLYNVFCMRGPVQHVTTFFFFWGLGMLALKVGRIRCERQAFSRPVLDLEPGALIRQEDALEHIRRLKRLPPELRQRLLVSRVWHALVRFKLLGSAEKVDDLLKYQGEMDATSMESSYSYLKFIIALIPILGFLGTVLGISAAVAGFSGVVSAAQTAGEAGLEAIQKALENVTIGLATAFDTTLIALVMSAILMFGLTTFQRGRIEQYCIENLLDRLWVPPLEQQFEHAVVRAMSTLPRNIAAELHGLGRSGLPRRPPDEQDERQETKPM